MSFHTTPQGDRIHISIFGKRNAGKSSLMNALTGQELAVVSEVKGTTTDPVYKAMELLPLGPVVIIDTPGLDDVGTLGEQRMKKALGVLNKTDIAILLQDAEELFKERKPEEAIKQKILDQKIPYLEVINKIDLAESLEEMEKLKDRNGELVFVSACTGQGIQALKEKIAGLVSKDRGMGPLVRDLLKPGDLVVLVVPIDEAAPKGRLILPQQQTIRDILEAGGISVVTKETELSQTLKSLGKSPRLVITDSQAFSIVSGAVPEEIPLTSFSILFARQKGSLKELVEGAKAVKRLKDGDAVLMAEGCTHHRQCEDIGTVKIPRWLTEYTGKKLVFETASGSGFPEDLSKYALIVHCGGCMLNQREMLHRIRKAGEEGIPMVNYGILIASITGILKRSLEPFPEISSLLKQD